MYFAGLGTVGAKTRTVPGQPGWLVTLNVKEDWESALDSSRGADTMCLVASRQHEGPGKTRGSKIMTRQRSP